MSLTETTRLEVTFTVEGELDPFSHEFAPEATISELLEHVRARIGRDDLVEVAIEDEIVALDHGRILVELIAAEFKVLHVSRGQLIEVSVEYNGRTVEQDFRPNVKLDKIVAWAISPNELGLTGDPSDFQLKLAGVVQSLDDHLGQVAKGRDEVCFALVFKVKPQG